MSPKMSPKMSPHAQARSPRPRRLHDRHSAGGILCQPKRNGAGAKGCWGTIMDQDGPAYTDKNDPNYDSDLDGQGFVLKELDLERLRNEVEEMGPGKESSESGESSEDKTPGAGKK